MTVEAASPAPAMRGRTRALDLMKGLLTIAMVLCHWLQFFGNPAMYAGEQLSIDIINVLVFPSFVFVFGCTNYAAYLRRPFKQVWRRMAMTVLKSLGAFYVSGVAYLVLCGGQRFNFATVHSVVTLRNIPGWSEFLVSFALYSLVAMVLFWPLKRLLEHRVAFWCVWAALFASAFIPYSNVSSVHAALFIGGRQFSFFPIVQYMPFWLLGMYMQRRALSAHECTAVGSASASARGWIYLVAMFALSGYGIVSTAINGWPGRFPPSIEWLTLPLAGVMALYMICAAVERAYMSRRNAPCRVLELSCRPIESMGARSLFYLLLSNLAIFSLAHTGLLPTYSRSGRFPFNLQPASIECAVVYTGALLLGIGFCASLAGKRRK